MCVGTEHKILTIERSETAAKTLFFKNDGGGENVFFIFIGVGDLKKCVLKFNAMSVRNSFIN